MVEASRRPDFDFAAMKTGRLTVNLMLPFEALDTYSRLVRVVVGQALCRLIREDTQPEHDVVFLLDEFARLKHFAPVEEGLAILRDYRVRLWLLSSGRATRAQERDATIQIWKPSLMLGLHQEEHIT